VSGRISTKTGTAPQCTTTLAVAQKVKGEVTTTSPGPMFSASNERCRAAVQELTARACLLPTVRANSCSKRLVRGPVVIQSDSRVAVTSSFSSGPKQGAENGK